MKKLLISGLFASFLASVSVLALAKLPALSDDAKAEAAEAAAKTAWTGKGDVYQLCKSQDQVAAAYFKSAKAAGKEIKPAAATPACADPGPFVYTALEATKPLEAAGAHSPATNAASPPSSKQPDATLNPANKP